MLNFVKFKKISNKIVSTVVSSFLSLCIFSFSQRTNAIYNSVQEYFNYVDSQHKPRVMIIGGEHITGLYRYGGFESHTKTDEWYKEAGGVENYFFVNYLSKSEPDFLCDVTSKKFLDLKENQWDIIVFENILFFGSKRDHNAIRNSLILLKPNGKMSCNVPVCMCYKGVRNKCKKTYCGEIDVCETQKLKQLKSENTLGIILDEFQIPRECANVDFIYLEKPCDLFPQCDEYFWKEHRVIITKTGHNLPRWFYESNNICQIQ